ncbi:MAG: RNA-binding protein [Nitrospirales bacterium]|nr:MAG: RNA-binding protein [Nitrospirales bacterium]
MSGCILGNLPIETTDQTLQDQFGLQEGYFSQYHCDRFTERSQGFEFIEMPNQEEAKQTIHTLRGTDLRGRILVMNEARPLKEKRPFKSHSPRTDSGGYPQPIISHQALFSAACWNGMLRRGLIL